MQKDIIRIMSEDMGVIQYAEEDSTDFFCRVIYSALACWIKSSSLDKPVGRIGKENVGASRRHIFEKNNKMLGSLIELYPEVRGWFYAEDISDNPVAIVRSRLIRHGDLLNTGFATDLVLSNLRYDDVSPEFKVVIGGILEQCAFYSGISMILPEKSKKTRIACDSVQKWMEDYIRDAWWARGIPTLNFQYLDPMKKSRNNYMLWSDLLPDTSNELVFARTSINKVGYEYYLLNIPENKHHRLDPLTIELGNHIRVILAMRFRAGNQTELKVQHYSDHLRIMLYCHLPREEASLLESYAWPVNRIDDMLEWVMPVEVWDYIKPYFDSLGFIIMEEWYG